MKHAARFLPHVALACALALTALGAACTAAPAAGERESAAWVEKAKAGALVLDVRSRGEWDAGHLEGARHVPVGDVAGRAAEIAGWLDGDKARPVIVYCASGRRSARAREALVAAGFTDVHNAGGLDDVRAALRAAGAAPGGG